MTSKRPSLKERALEKIGLGHRFRSGSFHGTDENQSDHSSTGSLTDVGIEHDNKHKEKHQVKKSHSHTIWYSGSIESHEKETVCEKDTGTEKEADTKESGIEKEAVKQEVTKSEKVSSSSENGSAPTLEKKNKKIKPEGTIEYVVKGTDTFQSISASFDITPSELKKLNKLTTQYIFPGQVLYVPERNEDDNSGEAPIPSPVIGSPNTNDRPTMDVPLIKMADRPPSRIPGHVERQTSVPSPTDHLDFEAPHVLSEDEAKQLDQECYERFIKVNVKHITDGQGVVSGVLLVTPNAVMFDPNVSDPLVVEHGPEKYGVIAPMDMVVSAAMYHDIAAMKIGKHNEEDDVFKKPAVYHDKSCPLYGSWCASHSNLFEQENTSSAPPGDSGEKQDQNTTINSEISEAESVCSCGASGELSNQMVTPNSPMKDIVSPVKESANQNEVSGSHDLITVSHKTDIHSPVSDHADIEFGEFECAEMPNQPNSNVICSDKEFVSVNLVTKTLESEESTESKTDNVKETDDSIVSKSPDKDRTCFYLNKPEVDDLAEWKSNSDTQNLSDDTCDITKESSGELRIGNIVYLPVEEDGQGKITVKGFSDSKTYMLSKGNADEAEERARSQSAPVEVPHDRTANRASLGSFGSFSVSPHLNAFVNYATGFFKTNPDVKDISDVIPDNDVKSTTEDNVKIENSKNGNKSEIHIVHTHSKNGKHGDMTDLEVAVENAVKLADKPELFQSFDKLIPRPAQRFEDPPLYLCLKLGRPINREVSQTCPIEAYSKLKKKPEYWFSIPRDKVDNLYAFFVQWTPEIYGGDEDISAEKRGFVVLGETEEIISDEEQLEVMDEYFGSAALQKDWEMERNMEIEIISKDEALKRKSVSDVEDTIILPELIGTSTILEEFHLYAISKFLPPRTIGYPWTLIYSTEQHGFSLKTMYRDMLGIDSPILIVVKDTANNVFGAMTSCELKISDHFYGTGESFLFTFYPEFQIFRWTGENNFFLKGNSESLSIGAGQGVFGLWLDGDLYHGRTNRCETYDNDLLTVSEDFVVQAFEAWAFIQDF